MYRISFFNNDCFGLMDSSIEDITSVVMEQEVKNIAIKIDNVDFQIQTKDPVLKPEDIAKLAMLMFPPDPSQENRRIWSTLLLQNHTYSLLEFDEVKRTIKVFLEGQEKLEGWNLSMGKKFPLGTLCFERFLGTRMSLQDPISGTKILFLPS